MGTPSNRRLPRSVCRFTLIELLVVIAIIAILASMLLPSLRTAKQRSHQAACTSNQKQVAAAVFFYVDDWDGWMTAEGGNAQFRLEVCRYLAPGTWELASQESTSWPALQIVRDADTALSCPSLPDVLKQTSHPITGIGWNYNYLGYGYGSTNERKKFKTIEKPTETIMVGDTYDHFGFLSTNDGTHYYCFHLYPPSVNRTGDRHRKGINVAYADGHVEWHTTLFLRGQDYLYRRIK